MGPPTTPGPQVPHHLNPAMDPRKRQDIDFGCIAYVKFVEYHPDDRLTDGDFSMFVVHKFQHVFTAELLRIKE